MKNVIITGVGGFLGGALARRLLKDGCEVYGISSSGKVGELESYHNFHCVTASFDQYDKLSELLPKVDYETFYHFAWSGVSGKEYSNIISQEKNLIASRQALECAISIKCKKFIFMGSSHEYLHDHSDEFIYFQENSIYGAAKKAAEIWCRAISKGQIFFNSVLFTNVFGVGDYSNRSTNQFISKMLTNEEINLIEGKNDHDWTYVDDAIEGILSVERDGVNGKQYYIGSRKLRKFSEIVIQVKRILNSDSKLNFGKYIDTKYVDYSQIDLEALYRDTGFECTSDFEMSILRTAKWLKMRECKKNEKT